MKNLKKAIRLLILFLLLIMAACGIGIIGNILNNREQYRDKEIKTESVDRKDDEEVEDEVKD